MPDDVRLTDPLDAANSIARLAAAGTLRVQITEDIAFRNGSGLVWVDLGSIDFHKQSEHDPEGDVYDLHAAVRFGGFEWQLPASADLDEAVRKAIPREVKDETSERMAKSVREGVQDLLRRMLLLLPVFDVDALASMPHRRPTTIVPDTSAVHQGALDFVCRFLSPSARIKVPAIVHMELQNNADNYLKARYRPRAEKGPKENERLAALRQHILSQGGIRTLLRMEFSPDVEIDRGDLGADPLRGIVTSASDPEDRNLGLQEVVRSFADRLIVETARRFQCDVRPDHPLFVLTSDQGMARMALAEGLGVMFFQSRAAPSIDRVKVTGTLFSPFSTDLYSVSFVRVLWELAVTFGRARVVAEDQSRGFEVWGIGGEADGATWQPLHAREDLLWARTFGGDSVVQPAQTPDGAGRKRDAAANRKAIEAPSGGPNRRPLTGGAYKFSPDKMLGFIAALVRQEAIHVDQAHLVLGVKDAETSGRYVRFLLSGRLAVETASGLTATAELRELWQSLIAQRLDDAARALRAVPSFDELCRFAEARGSFAPDSPDVPISNTARPSYLMLGEALGMWLRVVDQGVVWTPHAPDASGFPRIARAAYERTRQAGQGGEWLLTGRWLETLAVESGIHPLTCRRLVAAGRESGLLRVLAEGSTPDNRFDTHYFWALSQHDGQPGIERVYLYHGDFLLPGTAAVRIRIEEGEHAT